MMTIMSIAPSRLMLSAVVLAVVCTPALAADRQAPAAAAAPQTGGEPPPPTLPETIARSGDGRATVRAVRVTTSIKIDGRLDEAIYHDLQPASDFIQMEPRGGEVASEKTEVWVFYDGENVYVSFRAWESRPDRMIANEMRRDSANIRQADSIGFSFDTFRDRRNAILFEANALGARTDGQSTNERQYSTDWNPVWSLAAGKFDGGWTIEAALPFKSIRYAPGVVQDWGFQARRTNKWKNEIAYLTKLPPALGLGRADFSASLFANLIGLEAPQQSHTLDVKPYAIADLTTDNTVTPARTNDPGGDIGADAKYAITQNLMADVTFNTDFAQVEADQQQVNLTRFSLFFPEKRDFFLENAGIFSFGNNQFGANANQSDVPILFYSRRIGLSGTDEVPIWGGGRVTGRIGRYSIGALDMATRQDDVAAVPTTNFSVVRIKRDILRRSSIGMIATGRSRAQRLPGSNVAYGIDGTFTLSSTLQVTTYVARSESSGSSRDQNSYRAQMDYTGDRYGLQLERLSVDRNFNPEVGFVRRADMRKNYALARFSPRSRNYKSVRKFSNIGQFTYITDSAGRLSSRVADYEYAFEYQSSDRLSFGINDDYELLTRPFTVVPGAVIPAGGYEFTVGRIGYNLGQQRPVSGNLLLERGQFYNGTRTGLALSNGRVNVSSRLSIEPSVVLNWIRLPAASVTSKLIGSRVTYTVTPLMFVSALVQYNNSTHTVSTNARLRWEYRPGSEVFVVFNDEHNDAVSAGLPSLQTRAFIIKVNRFFRL